MRTNVRSTPAGSRGLAGRFILGVSFSVLIAGGSACKGASEPGGEPATGASKPAPVADARSTPTTAVVDEVPLPSSPVAYADELAEIDRRIEGIQARVEATAPAWLTLQTLADALSERAHLSGDYDDYAAAEAALAKAFELAPEGSGPRMSRARLHFTLHRVGAALEDLEAAAKRINLKKHEQAAIDGLRADIAFQRGDYEAARAEFERLAEAAPGMGATSRLATYRWKTGDFDGADALYLEALRSYTGTAAQPRAWLRLMRGLLDLDRGRHRDAYAHYQNAAAELSGYWLVEEHIAEIRGILGEVEPATVLYRDLIERTGNPEFMDALAEILAEGGEAAGAEKMRLRARKAYEELLERYPEAAAGHAIDHFFADESATGRVLELAESNHRLRPNGAAKILLAKALLNAGEAERAEATILEVLASPWRSAELHEVASEVFAARGDQERATAELAKAKAIDPSVGGD